MPLESLKLADYVINTATGAVTTAMISRYIARHIGEWRHCRVLWDFSGAIFVDSQQSGWQAAIESLSELAGQRAGCRSALVADEELARGLLRMFTILARKAGLPVEFAVFNDCAAAKAWLAT